jgi:hypothetical protein
MLVIIKERVNQSLNDKQNNERIVRLKPIQGLFWMKEKRPLQIVPMGDEARHPIDAPGDEFPAQKSLAPWP